jgi:flagellar biosynthesis protein FliQ
VATTCLLITAKTKEPFFYLIFFLSLAYKLITTGLLPNEEKIIESLNRTLLNQDPSSLFVFWVYRSICVVVGLQLIRIYITMELLEDPFSKHHNKYIRLLGTKKRFFEQLIRIFIIVIVSLKIFTEKDDWSNINTLASFLLSLYFGLLLLDCITLPPLKEWKNKKWSELIWPYMTIDFFGFGLAVLLYLMTSSSQNQTAYFIPIIVVLVVFLFLLFASLIHSIIKYFKEYCYFILDLLLNLYEPYYGGENKK